MAHWLKKRLFSGSLLIKRIRITVFCLNLFFVISALVVLSAGIFSYIEYQLYKNFLGEQVWLHAIGLIIVGIITLLITFISFFGKIRKNPCLLLYFLMILSVIYLFEIVSGITVLIEKSHLGGILTEHLNKTFNRIESNNEIWNHLQREMKCCGVNGSDDWLKNRKFYPVSCCASLSKEETHCTKETTWKIGCESPLLEYFELMTSISAGISVSFGCIQIIVIGFVYYLYKMFRKSYGEHVEQFIH